MTAFTLGEATALALGRVRPSGTALRSGGRTPARSGAPHRTGAPVLRGSIEAGTFEDLFFAVPAKGETDRLLRMARAALDAGRRLKRAARVEARELSATERTLAALTAGAVRVYEEICTLARLNAGRVFPTYDHLAQATALGRATVARALHALEAAGFLLRQRRFKRVEEAGDEPAPAASGGRGRGPRYAQTSNAYRPLLPGRILGLLPRWLRPAPIPVDALQHAQVRDEEVAAMHATLSCRELAQATVGGALGRVLASLGARIDSIACESQNHPQPLLDSYIPSSNGVGLNGQQRN
ncbi:helix-turn-helix domain-containing protein [Microvirga sp. SRT01]|uniref:Helix-turn-helix domain-containing protein n=1 Tax=Sphingomonas longa TaxID=2778730 RepID=A0ABS2DBZ8_9SPHN|nr:MULTISPECIES: helix-turn-helix domain-containing protein [Alphaproteobacteria]MBM6578443.1 helix-turn-helix domain-containing protein [Sphingomonas sp. BT552]MBR7711483.1 helix-turn-helix domain-containing protein [Microvirga sp. SRT01]